MSIVFSGSRSRSNGLISAVAKQVKLVNLKPLSKIIVRFDPFHENIAETRNFLFFISAPSISATNASCLLKTEVVCDRSEPTIICDFESQEKLILKSSNLTSLELLRIFNKYVSSRVKIIDNDSLKKKDNKKIRK